MSDPDFDAIATTLGLAVTETSRHVVADTLRTIYVAGLRRAADVVHRAAEITGDACDRGLPDLRPAVEFAESNVRALADEIERGGT